jgi:hypothetical protein
MALARVVKFDGVSADHMQALRQRMEAEEKPEGLPATEMMVLHDADAGQAYAIVFFANEEDYATGDATLNAMEPGDTPGKRASVQKCTVAVRMAD